MQRAASAALNPRPRACGVGLAAAWRLLLVLMLALPPAWAGEPGLRQFEVQRAEEGLLLSYAVDFDLPRGAEEALNKAVPLYFVAEAEVFSDRWYWRDKRVAGA